VTLKLGAETLSRSPHDEFLELCAISTSGELTLEEQKRLSQHLAVCASCREAMQQFESVVGDAISAMVLDHPESVESDLSWSQEQAEAEFLERLTLEQELGSERERSEGNAVSGIAGKTPLSVSQATWRNVWTLYAAGILLCIALGVSTYHVGIHRGADLAFVDPLSGQASEAALQQQMADSGLEREILRADVEQRDKDLASLRHELKQQSAEMARMKLAQKQLENDARNTQSGRQALLQERSELGQKLESARAQTQGLQDKLDSLEALSSADKQRATVLAARVTDLNRLLHDREATLDQQEELLAHDRDIRDLMGARDLYVAEVYDVDHTGETKKAYGRVFYTKGKSLIFYAYDLDQQAGVKNASSFQAWGRRGPDRQQALSLGVFYVDNASKKRWVLRFDDPKTLAQIDAVFVTVEPNGGSQRPSKKPLLFAYLHIEPNHP
jgi:hypothetical protein